MSGLARRLARPEVLALPPFDAGAREASLLADVISLDADENPYPPFETSLLATGLNRYPEPRPARLTRVLADLYGVAPDALLATRGADDAIDLLMRVFCRSGQDAVLTAPPTSEAYARFARLQGACVIEAPLADSFDIDTACFVAAAADPAVKLAFVCSPNEPTGDVVPPEQMLEIVDGARGTIVVLDEGWLEFANTPSLASEAARRSNLVVLRTLSRAYGLAGARIGAAVAHPETIELLQRAAAPYPLPSLSVQAALAALTPARRPLHADRIRRIVEERERVAARIAASPLIERVRGSGGNFLFLQMRDATEAVRRLEAAGIRVRFPGTPMPGGVRVSIGTPEENDALLAALGVGVGGSASRRADVARDTRETRVAVAVDLERAAPRRVETGLPFYDHMLDQVAAHGGFSLVLSCEGDLNVDAHHTVEDCAIALGQALALALGERRGVGRFGFALPMDEAEAQVLIDLSGRPFSVFDGDFAASRIGEYPTEMTRHVFRSLADSLGGAVHVRVRGENDHHMTEACFKAFGRALRQAIRLEGDDVPSTKGLL